MLMRVIEDRMLEPSNALRSGAGAMKYVSFCFLLALRPFRFCLQSFPLLNPYDQPTGPGLHLPRQSRPSATMISSSPHKHRPNPPNTMYTTVQNETRPSLFLGVPVL